jgi:LPS export ABC transporter protein LptC
MNTDRHGSKWRSIRAHSHPSMVMALVCAAVIGCKNDLDTVAAVDLPSDAPDRVTTNAEYFYSDSGVVRNRLRAGRVDDYLEEGRQRTVMSDGVELLFYDPSGGPGSKLTARRGTVDSKKHRMQVDENVVFVNARGEKLETEQLIWSQDSDRVYTDRPVRITRESDIIYGQGLDANQDFSRYTVRRITGNLFIDQDTLAPATK